jgi:RNA polymerase sigma factor (sigma-70 family)
MRKPGSPFEEEAFFESIRERITSVAKKRIRGAEYEDIVQETLIILKAKLPEIDDDRNVLPFAFQTLRNCIGNHYQKIRTEQKYIDFSADGSHAFRFDENEDWKQILNKALDHLRKDHERCANLLKAVMESAEIDELKKLLNVDEANVYRTLYRCRNRLKEIITGVLKVRLP